MVYVWLPIIDNTFTTIDEKGGRIIRHIYITIFPSYVNTFIMRKYFYVNILDDSLILGGEQSCH